MKFKKTLSLILAVVMMLGVFSVGFTGIAAVAVTEAMYSELSAALENSYVADLANYTTVNTKADDDYEGFVSEVNAYAFVHKIVAADNSEGVIADAAEKFYAVADILMSKTYGKGCYNTELLLAEVMENLGVDASDDIAAVLGYFMGNSRNINAGNWYHQFAFEVGTSLYTVTYQRMYETYTSTDSETGITVTKQGTTAYYYFADLSESTTVPTVIPATYEVKDVNYYNDYFLNKNMNPTLRYGTDVAYSDLWTREYADDVLENVTEFVENLAKLMGIAELKDGLGAMLENVANDVLFTDDTANKVFNLVYSKLAGTDSTVLDTVIALLTADATPAAAAQSLAAIGVSADIADKQDWNEVFAGGEVSFEWNISDSDDMHKALSAMLAPFASVLRWLLLGDSLTVEMNGVAVSLDGADGYKNAAIAVLEALSCPDVLTVSQYEEAATDGYNLVYNLLAPVFALSDEIFVSPIETFVDIIPNFLFFLNIGAMNDVINNILYPVYNLLEKADISTAELEKDLANLDIYGIKVNVSLPVDIDFNALLCDVFDVFFGDFIVLQGVQFTLTEVDLYTMCVGTLSKYYSVAGRTTVRLNSGEGDVLTAFLRIVFDFFFTPENEEAYSQLVINSLGKELDDYDRETVMLVSNELFSMVQEMGAVDVALLVLYVFASKGTSLTGTLAGLLAGAGLTVPDLFNALSAGDVELFISYISLLFADDPENPPTEVGTLDAIGSIFDRVKAFFEKIIIFFKSILPFDIGSIF